MLDASGAAGMGGLGAADLRQAEGGVCEYAYSPALAEKLHDPKVFALINLNIQRRFTSGHALALYENCYRFVRTGIDGLVADRHFPAADGAWTGQRYYETLQASQRQDHQAGGGRGEQDLEHRRDARDRASGAGRSPTSGSCIEENPQLAILDLDDGAAARQGRGLCAAARISGVSGPAGAAMDRQHGED